MKTGHLLTYYLCWPQNWSSEHSYFSCPLVIRNIFLYWTLQTLLYKQTPIKDEKMSQGRRFSCQIYIHQLTKGLKCTFERRYCLNNSNHPKSWLALSPYLYFYQLVSWSNNFCLYLPFPTHETFLKIGWIILASYKLLASKGRVLYESFWNCQYFCRANLFYLSFCWKENGWFVEIWVICSYQFLVWPTTRINSNLLLSFAHEATISIPFFLGNLSI